MAKNVDIEKKRVEDDFEQGNIVMVRCIKDLPNTEITKSCIVEAQRNEMVVIIDQAIETDLDIFHEHFKLLHCIDESTRPSPEPEVEEVDYSGMSEKEIFIDLLSSVDREGIDDLLEYLESSDFYVSPASGKYHGSYDGGLLHHSLMVYSALQSLYANAREAFDVDEIPEESLIIAALLHDLCKVNTYIPDTRNVKKDGQWSQVPYYKRDPKLPMGHGGKSIFIIQQFMALTVDEALAIYWHMAAWDISPYSTLNEQTQAYNQSTLAFLLHSADMYATYLIENKEEKELM